MPMYLATYKNWKIKPQSFEYFFILKQSAAENKITLHECAYLIVNSIMKEEPKLWLL